MVWPKSFKARQCYIPELAVSLHRYFLEYNIIKLDSFQNMEFIPIMPSLTTLMGKKEGDSLGWGLIL